MSSLTGDLAKAVVTELNATSFTQDFTATFVWGRIRHKQEDLASLTVTVKSGPIRYEIYDQAHDTMTRIVYVGIQKQVAMEAGNPSDDDVDPLVALVEEIITHFRGKTLSVGNDNLSAVCLDPREMVAAGEDVMDPENLYDAHTFTGLVALTFVFLNQSS